MGLDARIRYTKMVIKDAFIALLKEKPVNKVTVKEICGLAEINRATFYKYYSDPFDLLDKIESEMLSQLQSSLKTSPRSFQGDAGAVDRAGLLFGSFVNGSTLTKKQPHRKTPPCFPGRRCL